MFLADKVESIPILHEDERGEIANKEPRLNLTIEHFLLAGRNAPPAPHYPYLGGVVKRAKSRAVIALMFLTKLAVMPSHG